MCPAMLSSTDERQGTVTNFSLILCSAEESNPCKTLALVKMSAADHPEGNPKQEVERVSVTDADVEPGGGV